MRLLVKHGLGLSLLCSAVVFLLSAVFYKSAISLSYGLLVGGIASSLNLLLLTYGFIEIIYTGETGARAALCSLISLIFLALAGLAVFWLGTIALLGFAIGLAFPALLGLSRSARKSW